ncbi:4'-phosphopantetheinyl transferase superfamily protein [Chryseobacterium sp.]|uniref:4'-phosphopantetheinyl transferase family protein n=1 Tax=Chryseobacterium sp. TaxID=1871047 RepID=UPI002634905C|nr:4'-phosphopantetheinyl transferase superfamily protein [Chryseobacterium sp.]
MVILSAFISEEKHQSVLDRYLHLFSEDFRKDIMKYRRWQDAQLSLLGRVLLQYGLQTYYNISQVETGILPNKKPYLKNSDLHFNISHSKDIVTCIIAEFPIGIDIEFTNPEINYMDFKFQMTEAEFQEIYETEDKVKGFFTYWTRKEAVIKAHGSGMMLPLESFEIVNDECVIDGEKFFTREIFIHESYHSYIASPDIHIKKTIPLLKFVEV